MNKIVFLSHIVKRKLYAKLKSGKSFVHLFNVQSVRGMLWAWTLWNFYHWFYFILLPILSPFWQHVLSPPLVKSSKRIKHFIPQHTRLSIRSLAWPARLKSKPRPNRRDIRRNPSRKSVKYWEMWFHDWAFGSITDISWFWGIGRTVSKNLWQFISEI